jgi:uncharacterized protein YciI
MSGEAVAFFSSGGYASTLGIGRAYAGEGLAFSLRLAAGAGLLSAPAFMLPGMAHFALTLVHGPGWDASLPIREQRLWDEHAAFMDSLVADGFIVVGGPLGSGEQTLHLVQADDPAQIEARVRQDPWAGLDMLRVGSIQPWALWLDGR